jgi:hypothetical protein
MQKYLTVQKVNSIFCIYISKSSFYTQNVYQYSSITFSFNDKTQNALRDAGFLIFEYFCICIYYLLVCIPAKEMAFAKQTHYKLFCTPMISYSKGKPSLQVSGNKIV